tara:strand:- start:192 stop:458 length:267 start_codon:yes stop_codon:yes gene_type:complete
MSDPRFTAEAIRDRMDFSDSYRASHKLPYADSDIRRLLSMNETAVTVIKGLVEIAEQAMPDSYQQTDARMVAARGWLAGVMKGRDHGQ